MIYENEEGLTNGLRILAKTYLETMGKPYFEDEIENIIRYIELQHIGSTLIIMALNGDIVMSWNEDKKEPEYRLSKNQREIHDKKNVEDLISSLSKK